MIEVTLSGPEGVLDAAQCTVIHVEDAIVSLAVSFT